LGHGGLPVRYRGCENGISLPWQGLVCERGPVRAFPSQEGKSIQDLVPQHKYFSIRADRAAAKIAVRSWHWVMA
jgi:hypothetical protein